MAGTSSKFFYFRGCKPKTCEVRIGDVTKEVWILENWAKSWKVLESRAKCDVKVGNVAKLRFSLKKHVEKLGMYEENWLSLIVTNMGVLDLEDYDLYTCESVFKIQVDQLDGNMDVIESVCPEDYFDFSGNKARGREIVLVKKFIHLSTSSECDRLTYGIAVTPHFYPDNDTEKLPFWLAD